MRWICIALVLNLFVYLPAYNAEAHNDGFYESVEQSQSQNRFRRNEYLIKTTPKWLGIKTLRVCKKNRCLLSKSSEDDLLWLGFACRTRKQARNMDLLDLYLDDSIYKPVKDPLIDLNADGVPDLIVIEQEGMRRFSYSVYSLGRKMRKIAELPDHWLFMRFLDIDGDGSYEALGCDQTFLGWNACIAGSPTPIVILKFGRHGFELATEQMKRKPPTKKAEEQMLLSWRQISKIGKEKKFSVNSGVWSDMLKLIYTGNAKTAYRMLDRFWQDGMNADLDGIHNSTKDEFKTLFLEQLKQSPYFAEIRKLNPGFAFEKKKQSTFDCVANTQDVLVVRDKHRSAKK